MNSRTAADKEGRRLAKLHDARFIQASDGHDINYTSDEALFY